VKSELELYFEYKCLEGLRGRGLDSRPEYVERLNYEIEIIERMQFCGYFMIVQDFINWAKKNDILVGGGRGSAAGSLVAYCLRITNGIDPLEYGLLFERFLNVDRMGGPDLNVPELSFETFTKNILPTIDFDFDIDYN
jgi:DNA polymerase III subunit alpha